MFERELYNFRKTFVDQYELERHIMPTPSGKNMSIEISQVLNFVPRPILRFILSPVLKNRRIVFMNVTPYSLVRVYGRFIGMNTADWLLGLRYWR
jgi:hypothetical protein